MPRSAPRRWPLFGLALLAVLPFARTRSDAAGQAQKAVNPADRILGADNCIRCHLQPTEADRRPGGATELVRMDESTIWQKEDLHGKAFEALSTPLAKRMQTVLNYDVTKRTECLSCHAVDLLPEKKPAGKSLGEFYTAFGVGCEACHGFANVWGIPHARPTWRAFTPAEKAQQGQVDLRDPATRAGRCATCHVGSPADGKVVTHEMYAAGHPPLPPLEVMTFSRDQPMHYKWPKDLPYFQTLDPQKAWELFHYRKGESQPARLVAIGALGAFRAAVNTLAQAAEESHSHNAILDFAHFDCAACHHDLKLPSWRQARGYAGAPGRPLPNIGPLALLRVVLDHGAAATPALKPVADEFAAKYAQLVRAFDTRPFGDPGAIATATRDLATWADNAEQGLQAVVYTPEETRKLLTMIAAAAAAPAASPSPGLDFDAAQQLYWAFEILREECPDLPAAVKAESEALSNTLLIGLLKGNEQPRPFIADEQKGPLKERFKRVANYDPAAFRTAFARIHAALR
jgi:hypothetical protein